jgi:DNA-binding IscR family transcriptional regulator
MPANWRFSLSLQILAALAGKPDEPQTSDVLAARIRTNAVVVRRAIGPLVEAGFVIAQKGPGGGCMLAKPADEISLGDVYIAIESAPLFHFPAPSTALLRRLDKALEKCLQSVETGMVRELAKTSIAALLK